MERYPICMERYPTKYSDVRGSGTTIIENDGETLRVWLRGVEFSCNDFESFSPSEVATSDKLAQFSIDDGYLSSCYLESQIPIQIHEKGKQVTGWLLVEISFGGFIPNPELHHKGLWIALEYGDTKISGSGKSGCFENEVLEIQASLPDGVFMKTCINCLFSDYSPFGNSIFGQMMCFRNLKTEYLEVKSKTQFWSVHGRQDCWVQETYLCPEFERRIPGTGYRGRSMTFVRKLLLEEKS